MAEKNTAAQADKKPEEKKVYKAVHNNRKKTYELTQKELDFWKEQEWTKNFTITPL